MRNRLIIGALLVCSVIGSERRAVGEGNAAEPAPPNVVIFFCDDLGYGDLACFGHPTIRTPNLDRMAEEGQKWTSFYVAECVCTPSRAALLTGRLPIRTGMSSDTRRVLFPDSAGGLQPEELTIAEVLKGAGYATACVGKWHLGHLPKYLPTRQGFDSYFGIPYSNDMDRVADSPKGRAAFLEPKYQYWNVPLMRNEEIVERPADQNTITRRYTEEAVRFIRQNRDRPFFLYLAHTMVHVPLFVSEGFRGKSLRGLYGDAVEELDWSMGRLLDTLRELGLDRRTLVVFTSDNGPWLIFNEHGGSAGLLRDGKGSTWEGGMREPTVFWWPGTIPPGVVRDMGSTLDLLPTLAKLADVKLPENLVLDGMDISPALLGTRPSPRDVMFFYRGTRLYAVRKGPFKAHFITQDAYGPGKPELHDPPLLYHLGHDPSEEFDVAAKHPEVIAEIRKLVESHQAALVPGEPQLEAVIPAGAARAEARPATVPVTGRLTLDGQPVLGATVTFFPRACGRPAVGKTDAAGAFTLATLAAGDGAAPGEHAVAIRLTRVNDKGETEYVIPRRFADPRTSGLTATVAPSDLNRFDFDLASR